MKASEGTENAINAMIVTAICGVSLVLCDSAVDCMEQAVAAHRVDDPAAGIDGREVEGEEADHRTRRQITCNAGT